MLKIQNIILDPDNHPGIQNLYYTFSEQLHDCKLSFGGYFNSLWPQIWKAYTTVSSFHLCVRFRGEAEISIIQSQMSGVESQYSHNDEVSRFTIYRKTFSSPGTEYVKIDIPEPDAACRVIYFEMKYNKNCDFEYIDAYYAVKSNALPQPIKTAIIICTYEREHYLYNNLATLKTYFNNNPAQAEVFDVFIIDNGKTLPKDIENNNIFLFPNKNTGGSGGFARGILEALRSETEYTHVLLMDDDIEINTEALYRTYSLASLINENYNRAFISGSMLRSDIRNFQWEARARLNGLLLNIYGTLSLAELSNVLQNEAIATKHTKYDYAAWWYCCIPLKHLDLNSLPFPFFVRGDDIDYSLKYADKIIHLNGICVWHEPFGTRQSNVMDVYMGIRNFLTVNVIHKINFMESVYGLIKIFAANIFTYNYGGAHLVCCGLNDAISENEIFREDQLKVLGKYKPYNEVEVEMEVDLEKAVKKTRLNLLLKIMAIFTYGGHLLPAFLFRKQSISTTGYLVGISKCFFTKQVIIFNPLTGKSIIRNIDYSKAFSISFRFFKLLFRFVFRYNEIVKRIHTREQYYRTLEFWKNHLELD